MLRTAHITSEHQYAQHTRASHFAFTSFLTKLPTNPHFPHPHTIHNSRFIVLPDPVNRVNFPLFTLLTCPNVTGSTLVPSFNLDPPIFPHNEASTPYKPHHHIMYLRFSDLLGFRSVQNSFSLSLFRSLLSSSSFVTAISISISTSADSDPRIVPSNQTSSRFKPMAKNPALARFSVLLLVLVSLEMNIALASDSSEISPSPAPHSPSDSPSPSPTPAHSPPVDSPSPAPASSPLGSSPPAPTPHADSPPSASPASSPSPSPSPAADEVNHARVKDDDGKSSGGMSAGKKAGIAVGVIAVAGVGVLGCMVYRKRRQNIQRSEYGYAARRELL